PSPEKEKPATSRRDRRGHDDAGRATHRDPHLSQGGTASSNEFRHHPRADRAVAWPDGRRLDRPLVVVAGDFLRECSGGDRRAVAHSSLYAGLLWRHLAPTRCDRAGAVWSRDRAAVLAAGDFR